MVDVALNFDAKKMIRLYEPGDHKAIAEIFPQAIHKIASAVYTPRQCEAWSEKTPNESHWEKRCEVKQPLVFVSDGVVAGFLELDEDGHIDCLYVHPDHARKGIASQLIERALKVCTEAGLGRAFVEASICAKPVFEKQGFKVIREKLVEIRGERLTNFDMEIVLVPVET